MLEKPERELKPRNGHTLVVGVVARISGCENQKEESLEDQIDHAKERVRELWDGPTEFRTIQTKAKGERLDRPELEEIERCLRSAEFDLFMFDDLSRLIRGGEAARLLGVGVDQGTRSICLDDGIDTIDPTWEEDALNACGENVAHNERTSKRIKQKSMNRFRKYGATSRRRVYGYIVPPGVKTYDGWLKDPNAEPCILEGARILRSTLNGEAVAEYFRQHQVPVGPYARNKTWDGTMVLRFYRNTILKGMPQRGRMTSMKHHGTGQRRSKKNPKGPNFYEAPHLAFFSAEELDDLVSTVGRANANYRRKKANGVDPRENVPRKRTRFPGQHARCWYCGRPYHWGGNGITCHLMCAGAHTYQCWNSIHIDGQIVIERIKTALIGELYRLEGFDDQFREIAENACRKRSGNSDGELEKIRSDELKLASEKKNLLDGITAYGPQPMFAERLTEITQQETDLARRRYLCQKRGRQPLQLPPSVGDLRQLLEAQLQPLNAESFEFGQLLRQLVPEFDVFLVQLLDGGNPLPRARIKLSLGGTIEGFSQFPEFDGLLERDLTIDLFDPPRRERIRSEAARLAAEGLTPPQIAAKLGDSRAITVKAARALHHQMISGGHASPYIVLDAPPENFPKLRRHRSSKYRFEPIPGYVRRPL